MKRIVVFAHYDKDSLIDDYVVYYVKSLKEAGCDVVFVSCKEITQTELNKLNGLVIHTITENHDEYDFGSYKRGFLYLKPFLNNYDELIFANDSCYGPLYPISEVFAEMEKKNCDFWGITKNNFGYIKQFKHYFVRRTHIQSYFIAFKKNVFTQEFFANFINSIKHEQEKRDIIINYEIGLSELLIKQGYRFAVLVDAYNRINNASVLKWRQLILKYKMPFLKCSLPRLVNRTIMTVEGYQDIIKKVTSYPCELIESNVKRTQVAKPNPNSAPIFLKRIYWNLVTELPFFLRKFATAFMRHFIPGLKD